MLERLRWLHPAVRERILNTRPSVLVRHGAPAALRIQDRHPLFALFTVFAWLYPAERVDVAGAEFAGGNLARDSRRERPEHHVYDAIARLGQTADGRGRPPRIHHAS